MSSLQVGQSEEWRSSSVVHGVLRRLDRGGTAESALVVLNPVVDSMWGTILIDAKRRETCYHYHHCESGGDDSKYESKGRDILC